MQYIVVRGKYEVCNKSKYHHSLHYYCMEGGRKMETVEEMMRLRERRGVEMHWDAVEACRGRWESMERIALEVAENLCSSLALNHA